MKNATIYYLHITETNSKVIQKYKCYENAMIINGLSFGKTYQWKVVAYNRNTPVDSTGTFTFTVAGSELTNTSHYRLKLNHIDTGIDSNELILIDYNRIAVNRMGTPIWYIPEIKNKIDFKERIRDLKITKDGTFTLLNNKSALECDINGKIIWEAPEINKTPKDSGSFYHHCFSKLNNGNYMVLGMRYTYKKIPSEFKDKFKSSQNLKEINGSTHIRVEYGIIYEFSPDKKLVWSWDSQDHISDEDIFSHGNADTLTNPGPHMNSFDYNEAKDIVAVGFRDLSRICIIDKKTGKVVNSFGETLPSGDVTTSINFKFQHDSRFTKKGDIAIFNNNEIFQKKDSVSSVIVFNPKSKKVEWSFKCDFDSLANGKSFKGGSVSELKNGNFLVSMGHLNRLFEVTRSKTIVWDGFYERFSPSENKWISYPQYRISYASSLYPYKFGVSITEESNPKECRLMVKVANIGSEKDSYKISVKDEKGAVIKEVNTNLVSSGESNTANFKIVIKKYSITKNIFIEIQSLSNKNIAKKVVISR
ncbi:MAG TPA: aryl-sulfate sulfotransferase [Bacteroidia bacterium]